MRRAIATASATGIALVGLGWAAKPPPAAPPPPLLGAVIAHRAGRIPGPDNSLAAIAHAAAAGADAVEIDARPGPDGTPVCAHDADQVSGAPSLEEMLDAALAYGMLVEIDLKTGPLGDRDLVEAVAGMVSARGAYDRVWVSAFQPVAAWQVRRADPALPLGWPMPSTGHAWLDAAVAWEGPARWLSASVLEPEVDLVTEQRLARWERSFSAIEVWVVDDPAEQAHLRARGAVVVDEVTQGRGRRVDLEGGAALPN